MNLSFSQEINGKPTHFVEKIWSGIRHHEVCVELRNYLCSPYSDPKVNILGLPPKIHTIREDKGGRWKLGSSIHFYINPRTPNQIQFAPVLEVKGIQEVEVIWNNLIELDEQDFHSTTTTMYEHGFVVVKIDGRKLSRPYLSNLATNDGFESIDDFFTYFSSDFKGKIIHWTDYKY